MSQRFFDLIKQEGIISIPSPLNPAEAPLKMHFFGVNPIRKMEITHDLKSGKKSLTDIYTDLMSDSLDANGQALFLGVHSILDMNNP
jgi:hypothetical protein